jgi:hypothetical protein
MNLSANITITLNCLDEAALVAVGQALAGIGVKPTVATQAVTVPAPLAPTPLREAPVELTPETDAGLKRLEAAHAKATEQIAALDAKRRGKKKEAWAPPVPRPEGGYGKQVAPEGDTEWETYRAAMRNRLRHVKDALREAGIDDTKFMLRLLARYGDGQFLSTVPQGNLEALVTEAEAGPKEHPLTAEELAKAKARWEGQTKAAVTP